eukprot:scaffold13380_cov110-Cylindrotheca_fusiformis.AAC.8
MSSMPKNRNSITQQEKNASSSVRSSIRHPTTRRGFCTSSIASSSLIAAGISSSSLFLPKEAASAAAGTMSLATKLSKRDPTVLTNSVFNLPPSVQVYPEFLRGKWKVTCQYSGYLFPSQKITKERLMGNAQIPGFQKCSIATLPDIGKDDEPYEYTLSIDETTGLEDRALSLRTQIDANLGYPAVSKVLYNPNNNANRVSIVFDEYRTRNAERIELFVNGRESEYIPETEVFVCSEYIRQVTFGTGSNVGIPRQAVSNYAHFWTWRKNTNMTTQDDPASIVTGNLLTAAYLDPQDAMFFEEPSRPVVVYSHVLKGVKI